MSRLLKYLTDEYLFTYKPPSHKYEPSPVYMNPGVSEMTTLRKWHEVRVIADSRTKDIFFWESGAGIHTEVCRHLIARGYIKLQAASEDG